MASRIEYPPGFREHQQLIEVIRHSKRSFVLIGKLLHELKSRDNFAKVIGAGIDSWDDYISQPEIGLSKGEADRLMQIYQQFILELGYDENFISQIPIKNLHYLLPMAKEGGEVGELLHAAKELKQKDFRERVAEMKLGDGVRTYEYLIMRRCHETGSLTKVHDIDSDTIKSTFGIQD